MSKPYITPIGWFVEDHDLISRGPFKTENDAYLGAVLGLATEGMVASMIKQGLVTDNRGKILTPADFSNWSDLEPSNQ